MVQVGVRLEISPEIIGKLSSEHAKLWYAGHNDGSDNRINGDVILEASTYGAGFGLIAAGSQWIRKMFRNRGKTHEDLAAEKEAARINRTSDALEEMLLEYFQAAQKGGIDQEALDELIDTLEEMHGYAQAGKLAAPGAKELAEMRGSIVEFTAAVAEKKAAQPPRTANIPGADEFFLIREQVILQKELIADMPSD